MDLLKKFWPSAFKVAEKDVKDLIVKIVIYLIGSLIAGVVLGLIGSIVEIYCLVGIVLVVLKFLGIVK
jgi:hypothetical protein